MNIGFIGGGTGLVGGCGGGIVDKDTMVNEVVTDATGGAVVTREMTGGKRLVTGTLDCELEGGREVMCLGGKGRDAGLAVY